MKKLSAILLLVAMLLCLASCGKDPVTYDLAGGTLSTVLSEKAELSDVVATRPTKEGYVFAGWYSDANYSDYINPQNITKAQTNANRAFAKWIETPPESAEYEVRTNTVTITDGGRQQNKLDKIELSKDYNVTDLLRAGYTSFTVKITMVIAEIDDGYQHIFLYKNEKCISEDASLSDFVDKYVTGDTKADPNLLHENKYEHTPGAADSSRGTLEYEVTVSLDKLEKDLYLRYDASGSKEDDWQSFSVNVTVTLNK